MAKRGELADGSALAAELANRAAAFKRERASQMLHHLARAAQRTDQKGGEVGGQELKCIGASRLIK